MISQPSNQLVPLHLIEKNQRLSQSKLWQLQRNFFTQRGANAWSDNTVPHYVTNNRFIAQSYARVVFGWLRDIAPHVDRTAPVYIVELGAGTGRLAYHFLHAFFEFFDHSTLRDIPIVYVITDFSESTLAFWQQHEQLKFLFESGRLDMARFDGEQDDTLTLIHRGEKLSSETIVNPLGVIANYFFDGLIQDAFFVDNGQLKESLVTLETLDPSPDLSDPSLLERLKMSYEYHDIATDYYNESLFNQLLDTYSNLHQQMHLLFPVGALGCLQRLLHLSNGQLFLLTADKGYHREADLHHQVPPGIVVHGSFSMMVNYHALEQYTRLRGGAFMTMPQAHASLDICAAVFGEAIDFVETRQAYHLSIYQRNPDDFFALKKEVESRYEDFSLEGLLAYLRLCGWDSSIFMNCFPFLLQKLENIPDLLREEVLWTVHEVWKNYFFIGEESDVPFSLGGLLFALSYNAEAIEFLNHSLHLHGPGASTLYNLAACHYELDNLSEALACANRALEQNAEFKPAEAMRDQIQRELDSRE